MKVYLVSDCYYNGEYTQYKIVGVYKVKEDAIERIESMLSSHGYHFTPDTEGYVEVNVTGDEMHWIENEMFTEVAKLQECEMFEPKEE